MQQEQHTDLRLRAYLLEQGHRFVVLEGILSSGLLSHYTRVWASVMFETFLYILSVAGVVAILCMPVFVDAQLSEFDLQDRFTIVVVLQVILGVFTAPATVLAFLLKRNRKKKLRLRQAFTELCKMREAHERVMGNLNVR
jgi:hypothetical protein